MGKSQVQKQHPLILTSSQVLCYDLKDPSKKGVCPRTCLSTRPVKPRGAPRGYPNGAPPPAGTPPIGRTASPAPSNNVNARSASPALNPGASPNMTKRSMSPGPYGGGPQPAPNPAYLRQRSNSAGDARQRPNAPLRSSPMNPNNTAVSQASSQTLPQSLSVGSESTVASPAPVPAQQSPPSSVARKPVPNRSSS